ATLRFGEIALRRGELDEARRRYQEALPLFRRVQDALGEANCVARLGDLALRRADADDARERFEEALALYAKIPELYSMGLSHRRLAKLARDVDAQRHHVAAARELWMRAGRLDLVAKLDAETGRGA